MTEKKETISSVSDFGKLVRKERKRQGYTQGELAELCNVGITYISNLENGKQSAELGKALHVIRMLGIDLAAERRGA